MKITEYSKVTAPETNDILLMDGPGGTRTIKASDLMQYFYEHCTAPEMHRNLYRGKSLGTGATFAEAATAAQKTAISSGSFDDLFIGDYWTLGGKKYRIADMDYWYNTGDTAFTKHHLVMIPDTHMYTAAMNPTNTTVGGYVGSHMKTPNPEDPEDHEGLYQAKQTITAAFGSNLLTHREYLTNAVTSSYASAGAWCDSDVDLMNELMVYGSKIFANVANGTSVPINNTNSSRQLALFRLNPKELYKRTGIWLRDVVSSTSFASVYAYGPAFYSSASYALGVRPVFAVG